MVVTHASEAVPAMPVEDQMKAAALGAFVEHSLFAVIGRSPTVVPLEHLRDQIRAVGPEHVILSSDFGQPANGPIVEGFAHYLERLRQLGLSDEDLRLMIVENPRKLLRDGRCHSRMVDGERHG
jgi:predicted TIM-barrel fold metal-dependent hydrolase